MENQNKSNITLTDFDSIIELAKPYLQQRQNANIERVRLEHEIEKMKLQGESSSDLRNKLFIGSMLFVSVLSVSFLSYSDKLNEGLLTIFSMLIGGLFTAYATAIRFSSGKSIPKSDTDNTDEE